MPVSRPLRFLLNGEPVEVADVPPQTTLLAWLRDVRGLTGTKEGCAEGDCGACTVVLAETAPGGLAWKPINACIRLLPSIDAKAVFTVESLKDGSDLHPVQRALVDCHGSQCGFCTPGFAMSLFGLYKNAHRPDAEAVDDALSGNLCRCTGYRPIKDAARAMYDVPPAAGWRAPGVAGDGSRVVSVEEERLAAQLAALAREDTLAYEGGGKCAFMPSSAGALAELRLAHPDARLVAGATDVGLWITKQHRDLGTLIFTTSVRELAEVDRDERAITIGAGVSLADAFAALGDDYPELAEAWQRFASPPIRHAGTLGGNVANASPIGDSMPVLIALDATLVLRKGDERRELPVDAFYPAYQKTALTRGEFVESIRVPRRPPGLALRAYKIGKRFDQDISSVFVAFAFSIADGSVARACIGCGGVAATPVRARGTESVLQGRRWDEAGACAGAQALSQEFAPISDMRASAGYRRRVLGNLLLRFWHETGSGARVITRVHDVDAGIVER
jgi:xanthine dehydrogenase small subunit